MGLAVYGKPLWMTNLAFFFSFQSVFPYKTNLSCSLNRNTYSLSGCKVLPDSKIEKKINESLQANCCASIIQQEQRGYLRPQPWDSSLGKFFLCVCTWLSLDFILEFMSQLHTTIKVVHALRLQFLTEAHGVWRQPQAEFGYSKCCGLGSRIDGHRHLRWSQALRGSWFGPDGVNLCQKLG